MKLESKLSELFEMIVCAEESRKFPNYFSIFFYENGFKWNDSVEISIVR